MKLKKILNAILIVIISTMFFSSNVNAKNISTLEVKKENNELTVSGSTEDGVLAIAVLVYSKDNLIHMETCSSNNNKYSCKLNKSFAPDNYTVKVADYDGGKYITKNINDNEKNPLTFDGILLYVGLGSISILILVGIFIYLKKIK